MINENNDVLLTASQLEKLGRKIAGVEAYLINDGDTDQDVIDELGKIAIALLNADDELVLIEKGYMIEGDQNNV